MKINIRQYILIDIECFFYKRYNLLHEEKSTFNLCLDIMTRLSIEDSTVLKCSSTVRLNGSVLNRSEESENANYIELSLQQKNESVNQSSTFYSGGRYR